MGGNISTTSPPQHHQPKKYFSLKVPNHNLQQYFLIILPVCKVMRKVFNILMLLLIL